MDQKLTRIRVTHDVASTRTSLGGVHNVVLGEGKDQRILTFGSYATYVRGQLPSEIAENPYLIKEEVTEEEMARTPGDLHELDGEADASVEIPADLGALKYPQLLKLAGRLGLDTTGKKGELIARIEAARPPAGGDGVSSQQVNSLDDVIRQLADDMGPGAVKALGDKQVTEQTPTT